MKKQDILFLCTGNSCRSQMAEGWLRHLAGDRFCAYSAGTEPTTVNPMTIQVMAESGVDVSGHLAKNVVLFADKEFSYVITVCGGAREVCPVFPGKAVRLHWELDDPAQATGSEEQRLSVFRNIRDQVKVNVEEFLKKH
jgi:arsenate reductase